MAESSWLRSLAGSSEVTQGNDLLDVAPDEPTDLPLAFEQRDVLVRDLGRRPRPARQEPARQMAEDGAAGALTVPADFDAPLPEDVLQAFEGR
jgi:hypothetical protein